MGARLRIINIPLGIGALAATILWGAFSTAEAMEFTIETSSHGATILARGEIVEGDAERLRAYIKRAKATPASVSLVSDGGSLAEGIELGKLFRERRIATVVQRGSACVSACVFAFAGGVIREAQPGAKIGVHMASLMFGDEYIRRLRRILLDRSVSLDTRIRLIVSFNEQFAAHAMTLQAAHLQAMGVSLRLLFQISDTHHLEVKYLSRSELVDLNLVNTD